MNCEEAQGLLTGSREDRVPVGPRGIGDVALLAVEEPAIGMLLGFCLEAEQV